MAKCRSPHQPHSTRQRAVPTTKKNEERFPSRGALVCGFSKLKTQKRQIVMRKCWVSPTAYAFNFLRFTGSGGDFKQEIRVEGGSEPFAADALVVRILLEQAQSQVLGTMAFADMVLAFGKRCIQLP